MIHSRLLTLLWLLPAAPVFAEDLIKSTDNDIIVYGRAIEQIGVASSASEGMSGRSASRSHAGHSLLPSSLPWRGPCQPHSMQNAEFKRPCMWIRLLDPPRSCRSSTFCVTSKNSPLFVSCQCCSSFAKAWCAVLGSTAAASDFLSS